MRTYPNITIEQHIQSLLRILNRYFPTVEMSNLIFFENSKCLQIHQQYSILQNNLMPYEQFCILFDKLCREGHEWINLSGDSWYKDIFLISIEYSLKVGCETTAILVSGPTLDQNNKPLIQTRLKIVNAMP